MRPILVELDQETLERAVQILLTRDGRDPDQPAHDSNRAERKSGYRPVGDWVELINAREVPVSRAYMVEADGLASILSLFDETSAN